MNQWIIGNQAAMYILAFTMVVAVCAVIGCARDPRPFTDAE